MTDQREDPYQDVAPLQDEASKRPFVVGIGASAGGLEALTALLSNLPPDLGVCYVIVQHLSPSYRSMMVQLLGRETRMLVREINDGLTIEADTVNIAPASHNVVIDDDHFRLTPMSTGAMPRPSVNLFFLSLAEQCGESAMGIILSGTGSDGSDGIRALKASGGYTFAQTPDTAKYAGMPQAAIDTDSVDWVLPIEGIANEIARLIRHQPPLTTQVSPTSTQSLLKKLLIMVKRRTKVDFSGYKESTLWRRIERRMTANHVASLDDYLQLAGQNEDELDRLCKDILISVTSFFRDRAAFNELDRIIEHVVAQKQPGDDIRIWVPGCATGEEAYSIAMLVSEHLQANTRSFRVQIFATDIDLSAMAVARRGIYPTTALMDMDKAWVDKYFTLHGDRCEIIKPLREMVVFARQDLVLDPPFVRLDLISCRNVLIYFQSDLQAKLLSAFHYALNPNGYLFLGRSETVVQNEALFHPFNKDAHIFVPRDINRRPPVLNVTTPVSIGARFGRPPAVASKSAEVVYHETAFHHYLPPGVLIAADFAILHIQGEVGGFLAVNPGKPHFDLLHMICREFRADVQTLVPLALKRSSSVYGRAKTIRSLAGKGRYRMAVHPVQEKDEPQKMLVCFEPYTATDTNQNANTDAGEDNTLVVKALEDELVTSREYLQSVIEELETSNEEMQALNEEVQAANEELQSWNEELESANEELQSTNQELTTINEELQVKTAELAMINDDIENIINNLGFPLFVVNDELEIVRLNRHATHQLGLTVSSPEKKPRLNQIKLPQGMESLLDHIFSVLNNGQAGEVMVNCGKHVFNAVMSPFQYRPPRNFGVVVSLIDITELVSTQMQLRENQQKLLDIMNHSTSMVALKDLSGRYLFTNRRFEEFFGKFADELLGKTDSAFFDAHTVEHFRDKELDVVRLQQPMESEEYLEINGREQWMNVIRFPLRRDDGTIYAVCTQATDISRRKEAEEQLQLAARVFDRSGEGIMITDAEGYLLSVNEAFTRITGYSADEVKGKKPSLLSSGKHGPTFYQDMWLSIEKHGGWQGEIVNRRKNGELYQEWLTINAVKDANGQLINYVGLFSDISQLKESQYRIEFLATHDPLTALPNRNLFNDRIRHALSCAQRHGHCLALMFVDLDNFKLVNDSLGHDIGDQVVIGIGERLQQCVRESDTVARFGGDEFSILLDVIDIDEINLIARRIINSMIEPLHIGNHEVFISGSIGISLYPCDGDDIATLLKHADVAMYQAKEKGKNNFQFFCAEMRSQVNDRMLFETALHHAIEDKSFHLMYQPQIDIGTGRLSGMEALIRWQHPDFGWVAPDKFIPIAEHAGIIHRIGEWVLQSVTRQIAVWRAQGLRPPTVSINLSPRHFRKSNVPDLIKHHLAAFALDASMLGIEFTESALIEDAEHTHSMLSELKKMGVKVSLDDFGTGYSSLVYLKRYPIDEIKIDKSFIRDVVQDPDDRAIVMAILAMSQQLDIKVVAEGVETSDQLALLKQHGCGHVQGYFFAKPMTAEDISAWMASDDSADPSSRLPGSSHTG